MDLVQRCAREQWGLFCLGACQCYKACHSQQRNSGFIFHPSSLSEIGNIFGECLQKGLFFPDLEHRGPWEQQTAPGPRRGLGVVCSNLNIRHRINSHNSNMQTSL
ncbi:unnamed protein product [Lota lota]